MSVKGENRHPALRKVWPPLIWEPSPVAAVTVVVDQQHRRVQLLLRNVLVGTKRAERMLHPTKRHMLDALPKQHHGQATNLRRAGWKVRPVRSREAAGTHEPVWHCRGKQSSASGAPFDCRCPLAIGCLPLGTTWHNAIGSGQILCGRRDQCNRQ